MAKKRGIGLTKKCFRVKGIPPLMPKYLKEMLIYLWETTLFMLKSEFFPKPPFLEKSIMGNFVFIYAYICRFQRKDFRVVLRQGIYSAVP